MAGELPISHAPRVAEFSKVQAPFLLLQLLRRRCSFGASEFEQCIEHCRALIGRDADIEFAPQVQSHQARDSFEPGCSSLKDGGCSAAPRGIASQMELCEGFDSSDASAEASVVGPAIGVGHRSTHANAVFFFTKHACNQVEGKKSPREVMRARTRVNMDYNSCWTEAERKGLRS